MPRQSQASNSRAKTCPTNIKYRVQTVACGKAISIPQVELGAVVVEDSDTAICGLIYLGSVELRREHRRKRPTSNLKEALTMNICTTHML